MDYDPWGFAPFHYGRWAFVGGAWGWCPGPIFASPFYGPAFVGFIGGGFGFGFGFGGGVGWFPLGFGEPFNPWFHSSRTFINNVNISNTRINNVNILNNSNANHFNFRYAHEARAVTAASRNTFVNGQAVNRGSVHLTQASLRGAQVTNGASFSPTKASFTGAANARGRVSTPPSSVTNRSVMARTAPAAAASHIPVRTMNTQGLTAGRTRNTNANPGANRPVAFGGRNTAGNAPSANNRAGRETNNNAAMTPRQRELSNNRPPSANAGVNGRASVNGSSNASPNRPANGTRNWSAQGNATDRGRAPQGFGGGSSDRPANGVSQTARNTHSDRPPWAGSGSRSTPSSTGSRSTSPSYGNNRSYQPQSRPNSASNNNNRPAYSNGSSRSYQPPSRSNSNPSSSYSAPSRSYSAPSRSYSAPSRSYSAPSRSYSAPSYSAPSRSYSAPSRSYSAPSHSSGGVAARMVAAAVEGAVPIAAVVAAEDRTVAVPVHAAAAPTATNSRSNTKGPLQSRSGPFAFPSRHANAVRPQPLQRTPRVLHNSSASQVFNSLKQIGPFLIRHAKSARCALESNAVHT